MAGTNQQGLGFWATVSLLLKSARRRYGGRKARQQQLMHNRAGKSGTDWGFLGTLLGVVFMALIHGLAVATLYFAVVTGERLAVEQGGKVVVNREFLNVTQAVEGQRLREGWSREAPDIHMYEREAQNIARTSGGNKEEIAQKLRNDI